MEDSKTKIYEINMRKTKTKIKIVESKNYKKYTSNGIKKK